MKGTKPNLVQAKDAIHRRKLALANLPARIMLLVSDPASIIG
jgi:hypothetical protein